MLGNIIWAALPDSFGEDFETIGYVEYSWGNDFDAPYKWFAITNWCEPGRYGTTTLDTDSGTTIISASTDTVLAGFPDLSVLQVYMEGNYNFFIDIAYALLGGTGSVFDWDCSPHPPSYDCPPPVQHVFPPGTTRVERRPEIGEIPTTVSISDGMGILWLHSTGMDTLHISFAIPPGYSMNYIMPYGPIVSPGDSALFIIHADVVHPDGADTIWLFTDEPDMYPIVAYGEGGIAGKKELPQRLSLFIVPNPFNSTITINYHFTSASKISLDVFDMMGHLVSALVNEDKETGEYTTLWNGENMPSGIYFVRLKAGDRTITKRAILIR